MPADPIALLNTALEGRYRIERELGVGGMATVYLADDLRHGRKVALKVLKPELAAIVGAERFLAEIRTTASLQHPHVLPLHDSGEVDGFLYYVMPYVEGETLRDRLERERQLPVDEAVRIAANVAEALDYAHRRGVVHRDIKPANILLQDGKPVVADFGIALAVSAGGSGRLTETGLSLGTPHYMSPEQASGDVHVGPGTDIYALGCVLYEMLVGEPPYAGSSPQAILGKILQADPVSATKARRSVPANVDAVIRRALEKLPADRFSGAGQLAGALLDPGFRHGDVPGRTTSEGRRPSWRGVVGVGFGALAGAAAVALWPGGSATDRLAPDRAQARFLVEIPGGSDAASVRRLRVSPDGRYAVFDTWGMDGGQLWLWPLGTQGVTPLRGTEGAACPFWSPDSRSVGFFVDGSLRRVDVHGGPALTILTEGATDNCGAWNGDGVILFAHASGAIYRVSETGGEATPVTLPSPTLGHFDVGAFHADGDHFFYYEHQAGIYVGSLRSTPEQQAKEPIVDADDGPLFVQDSPGGDGYLLFTRTGALFAQRFDHDALAVTGPVVPISSGVRSSAGAENFSVSSDGRLLMFFASSANLSAWELTWVDREGNAEPLPIPADRYWEPRMSPDGTRVAVSVWPRDGAHSDLWVFDAVSGAGLRLASGDGEYHQLPIWMPGGRRVVFSSTREAAVPTGSPGTDSDVRNLWSVAVDGSGSPQRLTRSTESQLANAVSPDGETIIIYAPPVGGSGAASIQSVSVVGGAEPVVLFGGGARDATLSPDGRWVAYESSESGEPEVYVQPFPGPGARLPVSVDGGRFPAWSRDGRELFYRRGDGVLVSAEMGEGDPLRVLVRAPLFYADNYRMLTGRRVGDRIDVSFRPYDVAPDGRFLMMTSYGTRGVGSSSPAQVVVLVDALEAIRGPRSAR